MQISDKCNTKWLAIHSLVFVTNSRLEYVLVASCDFILMIDVVWKNNIGMKFQLISQIYHKTLMPGITLSTIYESKW